jgi:hypothetical protein
MRMMMMMMKKKVNKFIFKINILKYLLKINNFLDLYDYDDADKLMRDVYYI